MKADLKTKIIGFTFLAFLFVMGLALILINNHKKGVCTHQVTAVVSEIKVKYELAGDVSERRAYPVFAYEYEGNKYEANSYMAVNDKKLKVGDRIKIYVNPDDPGEIYLQTDKIVQLGMLLMGMAVFMVAWGAVNKLRKRGDK